VRLIDGVVDVENETVFDHDTELEVVGVASSVGEGGDVNDSEYVAETLPDTDGHAVNEDDTDAELDTEKLPDTEGEPDAEYETVSDNEFEEEEDDDDISEVVLDRVGDCVEVPHALALELGVTPLRVADAVSEINALTVLDPVVDTVDDADGQNDPVADRHLDDDAVPDGKLDGDIDKVTDIVTQPERVIDTLIVCVVQEELDGVEDLVFVERDDCVVHGVAELEEVGDSDGEAVEVLAPETVRDTVRLIVGEIDSVELGDRVLPDAEASDDCDPDAVCDADNVAAEGVGLFVADGEPETAAETVMEEVIVILGDEDVDQVIDGDADIEGDADADMVILAEPAADSELDSVGVLLPVTIDGDDVGDDETVTVPEGVYEYVDVDEVVSDDSPVLVTELVTVAASTDADRVGETEPVRDSVPLLDAVDELHIVAAPVLDSEEVPETVGDELRDGNDGEAIGDTVTETTPVTVAELDTL
jgi:hypothetical protein